MTLSYFSTVQYSSLAGSPRNKNVVYKLRGECNSKTINDLIIKLKLDYIFKQNCCHLNVKKHIFIEDLSIILSIFQSMSILM